MRDPKRLTMLERKFVDEYLVDFNAFQAAQRAGYTRRSAMRAWKIMRRTRVADALAKAIAARSKRTNITADRVLREYARIAFADIRNYTTSGKKGATDLKTVAQLSDDEAAAVVEVTNASGGEISKVKLHDKKKALDAIARHLGLFGKQAHRAESPAAAAERIRALIQERFDRLAEPDEAE
jgi:phage terminase small subunit